MEAVFFQLEDNLDNAVDEKEFRDKWPEAVKKLCPFAMCKGLKASLSKFSSPKVA